ncbi:MAG: hypothetical protein WB762_11220 [Candidatus Sulfotelmatobacter sp.]
MADLLKQVNGTGFPLPDRLVQLFVGSQLHAAKVHGTDDLDIYGAYIEPPEMMLGVESIPHFVWSTAGDEQRNGSNCGCHSIFTEKWAALACKGNPTALHCLFAVSTVRRTALGARRG